LAYYGVLAVIFCLSKIIYIYNTAKVVPVQRSEKTSTMSSRVHGPENAAVLLRKHFSGSCARLAIITLVSDKTPCYSSGGLWSRLCDVTRCLPDIYYLFSFRAHDYGMRFRLAPRIPPPCTRLLMVRVLQTPAQVQ